MGGNLVTGGRAMHEDALRLYSLMPKGHNASYYYRILVPFRTMDKLGLNVKYIADENDASVSGALRARTALDSDMHVSYQCIGDNYLSTVRSSLEWLPVQEEDGRLKFPPCWVNDTDDDLFNVMPCNVAFNNLGTKFNGAPLNPGDKIWGDAEDNNGKVIVWEDGVNINIPANLKRMELWRELLRASHLVTCSTPRVGEYVARETDGEANTFVFPNSIIFDDYDVIELAQHPNELRIMWQGSSTHLEDLYPIIEAMGNVAKRYPHVKFHFWGGGYEWVSKHIPKGQAVHIPWVPYDRYRLRLCTIGHDINLAPLIDNDFNRCRTAIKWYESTVIPHHPAVTLAQSTGAYQDEIRDGATGLLYHTPEEFEAKLCTLVENETLRRELTANALDWMHENRDAEKTVPTLYAKYLETRQKYIDSFVIEEAVEEPAA